MQQGPLSQQQQAEQNITALKATLEQRAADLGNFIVRTKDGQIDGLKTLQNQITFLKALASANGIKLNNQQAKKMLQQASATAADILALEEKPANPDSVLAIQIAIAAGLAFWQPGILGSALAFEGTRQSLHYLLDGKLGIYSKGIEAALGLLELQFSVRTLGSKAAWHMVENYGTLGRLSIPTSIILFKKGPELIAKFNNSHFAKTMADFTDIMGGVADDEVYEQYQGSIATMTFEDMVSSIGGTLSWLWNKAPTLRSTQPDVLTDPRRTCASSILPRI